MGRELTIEPLEERVLLEAVILDYDDGDEFELDAGDWAVTEAGELFAEVETGQAVLRITDLDANGRVDPHEITAVYAGDGLRMTTIAGSAGSAGPWST